MNNKTIKQSHDVVSNVNKQQVTKVGRQQINQSHEVVPNVQERRDQRSFNKEVGLGSSKQVPCLRNRHSTTPFHDLEIDEPEIPTRKTYI